MKTSRARNLQSGSFTNSGEPMRAILFCALSSVAERYRSEGQPLCVLKHRLVEGP